MKKGKDLKPHIGIFGRRNNGKSSFINTITGQDVAIVSELAGTTTDPVKKSVEIFGIGPAIMIDTAGIDDTGELGKKRIQKTLEVIKSIDFAILLIANNRFDNFETELIRQFRQFDLPFIIIHNKSDAEKISPETIKKIKQVSNTGVFEFSNFEPANQNELIEYIKKEMPESAYQKPSLFDGLVMPGDIILLITPIDSEAPDGRMILPQVMAWRDALDKDCICISVKETELEEFLQLGILPDLVVTDSQVFDYVSRVLPEDIPLTSFSILFARLKGDFDIYVKSAKQIGKLKDGDKILIMESCTHQVNCDDIGRHKLPKWLNTYTGKTLHYEFSSGINHIPQNLKDFALVIQCGGCVATRKQILNKIRITTAQQVPITNYGIAIAYLTGIYNRVLQPFMKEYANKVV